MSADPGDGIDVRRDPFFSVLCAGFGDLGSVALAYGLHSLQMDLMRGVNQTIHNRVCQSGIANDFIMPPFLIA